MIPDSVGWAFMVAVVVIILISWWRAQKRPAGVLQGIPVRPISSLRDGEVVRVQGMLRYIAGPPLVSPIGKRRCVGYSVRATAGSGDDTVVLIEENEGLDFLLRDDTGTARVELTRYELDLEMDYSIDSGVRGDPPPHVAEFVRAHGESHTGTFGLTRAISFTEGALQHGEFVTVLGRVGFEEVDEPGAAATYRGQSRRAVITAPVDSPMIITDDRKVTGKQRGVSGRAG